MSFYDKSPFARLQDNDALRCKAYRAATQRVTVMRALVGALFAVVLFGTSARAATYDWSFTSASVSGGGTLDTDVPVGPAQIVGISGTWGVNTITSLIAPGGFASNNNTLYALTPNNALDLGGFSFNVSDGSTINIFLCAGACIPISGYQFVSRDDPFNNVAGAFTVSEQITATPLPAALPLLASGLGLLGWAARRRKQMPLKSARLACGTADTDATEAKSAEESRFGIFVGASRNSRQGPLNPRGHLGNFRDATVAGVPSTGAPMPGVLSALVALRTFPPDISSAGCRSLSLDSINDNFTGKICRSRRWGARYFDDGCAALT